MHVGNIISDVISGDGIAQASRTVPCENITISEMLAPISTKHTPRSFSSSDKTDSAAAKAEKTKSPSTCAPPVNTFFHVGQSVVRSEQQIHIAG